MHPHPRRTDNATAQLVREAQAMQRAFDTRTAQIFMRMRNVPESVALRVLASPERRRQF